MTFTPVDRYTNEKPKIFRTEYAQGGHWGGDPIMLDKLFKDPSKPDPLHQQATLRDGVMSILIGIAARKSIAEGKPIDIKGLTSLDPREFVV